MTSSVTRRVLTWLLDAGHLLFWNLARKFFKALPPGAALWLTGVVAKTAALLLGGLRKKLRPCIAQWIPGERSQKELDGIARRSIVNYVGRRLEELYLGDLTKERTARLISVSGREHLEKSIGRGRGTVILLSHFGSLLLPLPAIGHMGYPLSQLAGPPGLKHHRPVHDKIFRIREREYARLPVTFLRTDLHLRTALKALRKNELLALAIDGREGDKWVEVQFLGKKAFFSPGPLRLALATGASIVPTFIVRQPDNTHRLIFAEPVVFDAGEPEEQAMPARMQQLVDHFDGFVRRHPCHAIITLFITEQRAREGVVTKPIFG